MDEKIVKINKKPKNPKTKTFEMDIKKTFDCKTVKQILKSSKLLKRTLEQ